VFSKDYHENPSGKTLARRVGVGLALRSSDRHNGLKPSAVVNWQIPPHNNVERTTMFRRFLHEDKGQDMVEYGLLAAFISIVAIAALQAIGPLVNAVYEAVRDALGAA
jgi:Flp pilus assembly pilin Flp